MPTATVIGSTGLVGSYILNNLIPSSSWTSITTISRRAPKLPASSSPPPSKLTTTLSPDLTVWPSLLPSTPPSDILFSALGTTRASAGGLAEQWKIDHDANVELCKAARQQGVDTFVFISAAGTRSLLSRAAPYSRMKNGVEDAIEAAGFPHAIVLRPGLIIGDREVGRAGEGIAKVVVKGIGAVSGALKNMLGQDASVIARAAVRAAEMARDGKAPSKFWVLEAADIIKYGKLDEVETVAADAPAGSEGGAASKK